MCHLFYCVSLSIDLLQRLITYAFACFLFVVIFFLLLCSLIAGMTYGYKYYVAEWISLNTTFRDIQNIDMYKQYKLAEYDPKQYKQLMSYWIYINTSTTTTPNLRYYRLEDDVDDKDLDVIPIDRATVNPSDDKTTSGIKDQVKKLNWVVHRNMTSDAQALRIENAQNYGKPKIIKKYLVKLDEKDVKRHTQPNRYSEFSGFPVNEVVVRPMAPESTTNEYKEDSTRDLLLKRRTVKYFTGRTKLVVTSTTKKSIALDILQKKLMSLHSPTTTNTASLEGTTDIQPKQYLQVLNWLLSQKNKFKTSTEKMILV